MFDRIRRFALPSRVKLTGAKPVPHFSASALAKLAQKYSLAKMASLRSMTTLRIGGLAEFLAEPNDVNELTSLISDCDLYDIPYRILGRGSNLFVESDFVEGVVIRTTKLDKSVKRCGGKITVGTGATLQGMLVAAANFDLGGCAYLHSVPGNVGGAIFMNAGRGKAHRMCIGDHVSKVTWFDGKRIRVFNKRRCKFGHRRSAFQSIEKCVILSAELNLFREEKAVALEKLRERIQFVKKTQDASPPNAGSVFYENFSVGSDMLGVKVGEAEYSSVTENWINNLDGDAADVRALIELGKRTEKGKSGLLPKLEWQVW